MTLSFNNRLLVQFFCTMIFLSRAWMRNDIKTYYQNANYFWYKTRSNGRQYFWIRWDSDDYYETIRTLTQADPGLFQPTQPSQYPDRLNDIDDDLLGSYDYYIKNYFYDNVVDDNEINMIVEFIEPEENSRLITHLFYLLPDAENQGVHPDYSAIIEYDKIRKYLISRVLWVYSLIFPCYNCKDELFNTFTDCQAEIQCFITSKYFWTSEYSDDETLPIDTYVYDYKKYLYYEAYINRNWKIYLEATTFQEKLYENLCAYKKYCQKKFHNDNYQFNPDSIAENTRLMIVKCMRLMKTRNPLNWRDGKVIDVYTGIVSYLSYTDAILCTSGTPIYDQVKKLAQKNNRWEVGPSIASPQYSIDDLGDCCMQF